MPAEVAPEYSCLRPLCWLLHQLLEVKGSRYYLNICNTLSTPRWRDVLETGVGALSKKWFWILTGKCVSSWASYEGLVMDLHRTILCFCRTIAFHCRNIHIAVQNCSCSL